MVDESVDTDLKVASDDAISASDIITDLVSDAVVPGFPAPVRRNFLKAFGQLCTAAVDIPAAYLSGKADERRAETAARIKLINVTAGQIAQQMEVDREYARVAVRKFGQRVLREQINLDLISQRAASELRNESDSSDQTDPEESGDTINDDWLNAFEAEGRQISTEEMRTFFGKMLAGEIKRPGSYSTRTVRILGSLDQKVSNNFVTVCSMGISQFQDFRVPSLGGNAGSNALQNYGLNFDTLNLLNEHGLVIADYNSQREITPCVVVPATPPLTICIPFDYQGRHWMLVPKSDDGVGKKVRINGVALTTSGRELSRIVEIKPMPDYSRAMAEFFDKRGFRMIEVDGREPRAVDIKAGMDSDSH